MTPSTDSDGGGRKPIQYRRIANVRPVGAVHCSKCGATKHSGARVRFEITRSFGNPGESEKRIMCDGCIRRLRAWYKKRVNEHGYVPTKWEADDE